ncbi:SMI1/KNR4 family protein [Vibrio campbellii]|uniref:SMI1/KNR4 family protein n=1 Tax=Vibrio campbellii TaxID=680 RepID=UPI00210B792E|nr:SMI1/KNR4 family protein [Vibrio campbellii]UTZ41380.1 SMI1/KNR4 family protein [Vibrio campbellii]
MRLELPDFLIEVMGSRMYQIEVGSFSLKQKSDSYGNHLDTELGQLCSSKDEVLRCTEALKSDFVPDGCYGSSELSGYPGEIRDITDFSKIVCFGYSSDGAPFCLDFRDGCEPSIIWWDDVYWRRISPNFKCFLELFKVRS